MIILQDERPITFIGNTQAQDQDEQVHEFQRDGVITGALVGTEVGQEYALQQYATLIRNGTETNLWQHLDKSFLAGNGRDYDLPLRFEFTRGDELILRAENENTDHEYHHAIIIRVDYETSLFDRLGDAVRRVA